MRHLLTAALFAPLLIAAAPTPDMDVRSAAKAFDQAQLTGDKAALERFLARDFIIVRGSGKPAGRDDFIAGWLTPGVTFEPLTILDPVFVALGPQAAIVGGRVELRGTENGKPFVERFHYSDVFAWRDGRWQVVFVQVTPTKP
ncbi:MAG: nuclear transport factor 2 family protein [Phenylobacterium sp.]|uniref:nuclear transport factor 2 family protein n=1 Tax=Phenylobacterium sp. TaxID=1871053 RepID=UPI002737602A|nr:nuclear transport factor 2 family protein [Phenylobacterium sp.]MDP3745925.1 nuclear transport factor 2 family protein [Phenylobacterium sp.]